MPTYNERANLAAMVRRLKELGIPGLFLLVVDDSSPDGTGELADGLAQDDPAFLLVLHRPRKMGLGTAYVAGFRWALAHDADYVIEMDADFSHPPEVLRLFLEKIRDYDVVVGSRFARGGALDPSWGIGRRLLSWGGNLYARLLTGLPVLDVTAGFKCFRRAVLAAIDLDRVRSEGFAFQVEMAYACHRKGFRVAEVPIRFVDRTQGKSKMSWKIIWEAFWRVVEIRGRY
ncbi:MAG: polyprenol monophosphomannose synthase [Chloroflexi bacterium]|nr:polyprenol monophosphomannose synthase [Chloroflexota bacterium]